VVLEPLEGGVREHEVELARERSNVPLLEAEPAACMGNRLREHGLGAVEAEGAGGPGAFVEDPGELASATAEVNSSPAGHRFDQGEEVEEGPAPLVAEAVVLVGIPGGGHRGLLLAAPCGG